jgi:hypothetical protein
MRQFKYKDTDFFRISVYIDFRGGNKILGTPEHVMRQFAPEGQGLQHAVCGCMRASQYRETLCDQSRRTFPRRARPSRDNGLLWPVRADAPVRTHAGTCSSGTHMQHAGWPPRAHSVRCTPGAHREVPATRARMHHA